MPTTKQQRRRALELLEASIDGCTEAIMLSYGFKAELLVELVNAGFATASIECMIAGGRRIGLRTSEGDETLRAPVGARVRAAQRTNGLGSRTAHGNGTAFSAVAPSERPVLPSIDPIFGSGFPPGPNSHPTFRSLIRFRPDLQLPNSVTDLLHTAG